MARRRPTAEAAARKRRTHTIFSSKVPWEKFSRATLMPARIMASMTAGSEEAGPMVATILVLCAGNAMGLTLPGRFEDCNLNPRSRHLANSAIASHWATAQRLEPGRKN